MVKNFLIVPKNLKIYTDINLKICWCILFKGKIPVNYIAAVDTNANTINKKVILKNCGPFVNCINKKNNTQVDNAKDNCMVILRSNLIEYSNNYSKTSGILCQYCKNMPAVNNNGSVVNFNALMLLIHLVLKQK